MKSSVRKYMNLGWNYPITVCGWFLCNYIHWQKRLRFTNEQKRQKFKLLSNHQKRNGHFYSVGNSIEIRLKNNKLSHFSLTALVQAYNCLRTYLAGTRTIPVHEARIVLTITGVTTPLLAEWVVVDAVSWKNNI